MGAAVIYTYTHLCKELGFDLEKGLKRRCDFFSFSNKKISLVTLDEMHTVLYLLRLIYRLNV